MTTFLVSTCIFLNYLLLKSFQRQLAPPGFSFSSPFSSLDSWLITQGVHIGLYGFFYRTAGGQGGRGSGGGGGEDEDDVIDIRLAASFFFLTYALLCSILATRVIGGTVAASTVAIDGAAATAATGGDGSSSLSVDGSSGDGGTRNDLVIQAISSYEVTAAQASDATAATEQNSPAPYRGAGFHPLDREAFPNRGEDVDKGGALLADNDGENQANPGRRRRRRRHGEDDNDDEEEEEEERRGAVSLAGKELVAGALAAARATRARRESLRRGLKAYMRLTVAMMVGVNVGYNIFVLSFSQCSRRGVSRARAKSCDICDRSFICRRSTHESTVVLLKLQNQRIFVCSSCVSLFCVSYVRACASRWAGRTTCGDR